MSFIKLQAFDDVKFIFDIFMEFHLFSDTILAPKYVTLFKVTESNRYPSLCEMESFTAIHVL